MKSLSKLLCCLATLFGVAEASAISRVGNSSVGDASLGFVMPVLPELPMIMNYSEGRVLLRNPNFQGSFRQEIMVQDFSQSYPEFAQFSREELRGKLIGGSTLQWHQQTHANPCVDTYFHSTDRGRLVLLAWGSGRGILMLSGPSDTNLWRMLKMAESLQLQTGACTWQ